SWQFLLRVLNWDLYDKTFMTMHNTAQGLNPLQPSVDDNAAAIKSLVSATHCRVGRALQRRVPGRCWRGILLYRDTEEMRLMIRHFFESLIRYMNDVDGVNS
ncbi:MAG: hypothetical protein ACREFB_04975, partial [Stellaceae bacterium]